MNFFDTKECEWSDLDIFLNGTKITKVRALKYKKTREQEHLFAAGADPISIQKGNKTYTGELRVLKGALDDMNRASKAAGGEDITDVTWTIGASYKEKGNRLVQFDTLQGVEFGEFEKGMEQNAKFSEITLPFLYLKLLSA